MLPLHRRNRFNLATHTFSVETVQIPIFFLPNRFVLRLSACLISEFKVTLSEAGNCEAQNYFFIFCLHREYRVVSFSSYQAFVG
jgi:hypothetical protein